MVKVHLDVAYSYSGNENKHEFLPTLPFKGHWLLARMLPCIRPLAKLGQAKVVSTPTQCTQNSR
jgi:hypothetical protein